MGIIDGDINLLIIHLNSVSRSTLIRSTLNMYKPKHEMKPLGWLEASKRNKAFVVSFPYS